MVAGNVGITGEELLGNQSMWDQMKEIAMFTGPAAGLWLCGPLMSLIDTAVIGQSSSLELAALGNSILSFFFFWFYLYGKLCIHFRYSHNYIFYS